jgi:hypothetical protein
MKWVPRDFAPGVKRPGREPGRLPSSGAEVKNEWNYNARAPYAFTAFTGATLPSVDINQTLTKLIK